MNIKPASESGLRQVPLALLVDADEDSREMYAFALKQDRWDVAHAADGPRGLESALSMRPDVVISELQLPELDGLELCRRLRRQTETETTPIVIVTASAFPSDVERATEAGGDVVLCKPCPPFLLLDVLHRLIEESRARKASLKATVARAHEAIETSRDLIQRSKKNGVKE